jgi:glycosyltransferase involved in cell wall biosynthesis
MKVAVVCDSPDEKWPSMDLVGTMLTAQLEARSIAHETFAPPIRRVTGNLSADRVFFRFMTYPGLMRRARSRFDVFHIVDHSYAQLAHEIPAERCVITCHDLDTFRSVLQPEKDPRGVSFRLMTSRILSGFRKAAHVACDSVATFSEIRKYDLLPEAKLSVVPLGVHPACSPEPDAPADAEADRLLGGFEGLALMHVGSTLARKRLDLVLKIFASARERLPGIRLIRVGGELTATQRALARELKIESCIFELPFLDRKVLAAVYRKAALVVQPSDAEGFGLPVAEAMACGTPVIASDLPVLREVGGSAATYCPPGELYVWSREVVRLLKSPLAAERTASISQASHFSWVSYATNMVAVYNRVLNV